MTVPPRPSSSESLELGKVESSQWLLLHVWSVGSISVGPVPGAWPEMPPFLDPSKRLCGWYQAPFRIQS